jgi:hypothetical protein
LGNARLATKVKHDFKMSDRTFAWLRVQTLAEAKDWEVRGVCWLLGCTDTRHAVVSVSTKHDPFFMCAGT